MVEFRTYRVGDRKMFKPRIGDYICGPEYDEEAGPTWTLLVDGCPVGIVGLSCVVPGVYDMFAFPSERVRGHGLLVMKFAKRTIATAWETLSVHRIQATCLADNDEYNRFLVALGFKKEGVLRQVSPNRRDLAIYSIVDEDDDNDWL